MAVDPDFTTQLAILCTVPDKARQLYAEQLADQLNLPLLSTADPQWSFLLVVTETRLELRHAISKAKPLAVDFLSAALKYRCLTTKTNSLIAKAVGIKGSYRPYVMDATAGLGVDSFLLAQLGCKVDLLERSPIIAALLEDGLNRYQQQSPHSPLPLTLIKTDAITYLSACHCSPDVVYLDPMFPERQKAALGKQAMRTVQQIVGTDTDAPQLLSAALQCAGKRVVVKRPRLAAKIAGRQSDLTYTGNSSRFDVYLIGGKHAGNSG